MTLDQLVAFVAEHHGDGLAGQKDVATLYEYWAFLQLAGVVADAVGATFDLSPLVELRRDGLNQIVNRAHFRALADDIVQAG